MLPKIKRSVFIAVLLLTSSLLAGQRIPTYFFAQNGWMYDSLGDVFNCRGEKLGLKCKLWGKIHKDNTWKKVAESGVRLVRFGGEHADENMPTRRQYLQMIDSARAHGMEILLQVPYNNNYYTADTAAALVHYINVIKKRKVRFWGIGNEPDLPPPNGYGYYSASPVADYVRQFAVKMKAVDSSIKTLAPELTYYDNRNNLITELATAGGFFDITGRVPGHSYYYVDIISFHSYPFDGNHTREQVISNLRDPWHIQNMLTQLNRRLDSCNKIHGRTGKDRLRIALTETNLNYINSKDEELNAHSFLAGQFWCELMAVALEQELEFLGFWSVIENSLGYIDEASGRLWPTYHHYKLLATNMRGTYHKVQLHGAPQPLKALASADSTKILVVVLNQQNNKLPQKYTLSVGDSAGDQTKTMLSVGPLPFLNGTIFYEDSIEPESTQLLLFDYAGKLTTKYTYARKDGAASPRLEKKLKQAVFTERSIPGGNE